MSRKIQQRLKLLIDELGRRPGTLRVARARPLPLPTPDWQLLPAVHPEQNYEWMTFRKANDIFGKKKTEVCLVDRVPFRCLLQVRPTFRRPFPSSPAEWKFRGHKLLPLANDNCSAALHYLNFLYHTAMKQLFPKMWSKCLQKFSHDITQLVSHTSTVSGP